VLHSLAAAINRFSNLTDILNTAVDVVMETVNPDGVLMYVLNRNAGILELREHRGVSAEFARSVEKLSISKDLKTSGAATGSPGGMEYTSNNLHLAGEAITKEGVLSQYVVPLVARDEVVGTICLLGRTQRTYAPEEKQLLALIGAELGVAAERAQLTEEKERAGMQFRQLFERAHDAIWMQDMGGKILASNQAAADYTGYRYGEGVGMNVAVFLTPEGLQLAREVRRKLLAGEDIQQPYEQKVIRKDGSFATIMLTTSLVRDETGRLIFQHISRDVTRERRLAENLRLYAQQITRAHEEERKRIARELHDDSMQALIILSRRADEVLSTLGKRSRAAAHAVEELRQEIDAVLARMRLFAQDLRPPTLEYLGLIPAARELVLQTEHQSGIATTILVEGEERHFSPEDELLIYRIIQEALNNVRKHAEARHATVFLRFGASQTTIQVKDDGRGFNAAENMGFVQAGKIGLAGMQERADLLGGSLTVESAPGRGATVTLMVPGERWRKLPATSN
jgi:PAS domain S-box-containing protein